VQVTPEDISGFRACVDYLSVVPSIKVHRPGGVPARPQQERNGKVIPGREEIPPKPYALVQMLDQDGNGFVPIENNQGDRDRQIQAESVRRIKERCNVVAGALATDLSTNTFSTSTIQEAIQALRTLAG